MTWLTWIAKTVVHRTWTDSCQALVMYGVQKGLDTSPVTASSCDVSQALYAEVKTPQTLTCLFKSWLWFLWPTHNANGIFAWITKHYYEDNDHLLDPFNWFIYKPHFTEFWTRKGVILSHLDCQEINISTLLWISFKWNQSQLESALGFAKGLGTAGVFTSWAPWWLRELWRVKYRNCDF